MDLEGSSDHLQQTNAALDHDDMTNLLTRSTVLNIHLSVFTRESVWQADSSADHTASQLI